MVPLEEYAIAAEGFVYFSLDQLHGPEFGGECGAAFFEILERDKEAGKVGRALFETFQANHLSVQEAGLALLDGCLSSFYALTEGREIPEDVAGLMKGLERLVDHIMTTAPSRILPRNGTFGRAATAVGMDEFFRPIDSG